MNSLNSILLEGNLEADPTTETTSRGDEICRFNVVSDRFFKHDDKLEKEQASFEVRATARLGTFCAGELKKERGVRVISRLAMRKEPRADGEGSYNHVYIFAEHVEFKPEFGGNTKD